MDLEQAITTALRYENQLRDIYLQGAREANDPKGKKIYQELDYVSHSGTWFGFEEFNLEVE
jgi:rubrerythrin